MIGVYVHYPYCRHHCAYCDFNVATPRNVPQAAYTDALVRELRLRAPGVDGPAGTLYVGGGTPSRWTDDGIERFVEAVEGTLGLAEGAEVTLEANPEDVTTARLERWRAVGISRVSLGLQSLRAERLAAIDRRHDPEQALDAVRAVAEAGLRSWTLDLMFGLPGQSVPEWEEDVHRAVDLGPPHLSVYSLTVEPRTMLARQVRDGRVPAPDDALQAEMLFAARRILRGAGYVHYEVSNYALPGHEAVHNRAYWEFRPYLGLGPGAHSFLPPRRQVNVRRPSKWIEAVEAGRPVAETEHLDEATLAFERVMTGLRDLERGVDPGEDADRFEPALSEEIAAGRLERVGPRVRLTEAGLRFMDDVLLALLPG
ncbi:MAG: radical SAM family heme chaperone HemW [Myxococcota bacterium]